MRLDDLSTSVDVNSTFVYKRILLLTMRDYENSPGSEKYKTIVAKYLAYRQMKQVIHSTSVLRDFVILEMSNVRMEPIRFNSTTFSGKLDLLDHIISYRDTSPDVLAYRMKMQAENPTLWPK